eukprot:TRINITY_DN7573_c0_g1_i1.p2 TRINITY_DN7573_c0_g1~~TRINITY_DN7573_c0_g1_i1.p2  ORF type:complete len:587 (+),score=238.90 TRINITY_DN7573_c0_g1_i1:1595-3355(+)
MAGHLSELLSAEAPALARAAGVELSFFVESRPLGTAGGLPMARDFLAGGDFYVLYADIAAELDLAALLEFHQQRGALATITAHPNDHPHESDLLEAGPGGRVRRIWPKDAPDRPLLRNLVPAALYCLSPKVFDHWPAGEPLDFIADVFPALIAAGLPVYAYDTPEYLRDMGTPARYAMVEADIASGRLARSNRVQARPAVFLDRDGTLNPDRLPHGVGAPEDLELLPGAAEAVRLINQAGDLAVLVTNQPQVAKGFATLEDVERVNAQLELLLGLQGAKLDRIYFCPHHPEAGHPGEVAALKKECACRKPAPGMLERAMAELPVERAASCLIGDTWRDMGAARAAGVWAYGLRGGEGCVGCVGQYRPELMFADVLEAARFAVGRHAASRRLAQEVSDLAKRDGRRPLLVGVAGPSRAGKSCLAHALVMALGSLGLPALRVQLDDWIVPGPQREAGMDSPARCRVELYPHLIAELKAGQAAEAPGYDPRTLEAAPPTRYDPAGKEVLVLEGLYACHESIIGQLGFSVFLDAPEVVLAERFRTFYTWKGLDQAEINDLLAGRRAEEWPAVRRQAQAAAHLLTSEEAQE